MMSRSYYLLGYQPIHMAKTHIITVPHIRYCYISHILRFYFSYEFFIYTCEAILHYRKSLNLEVLQVYICILFIKQHISIRYIEQVILNNKKFITNFFTHKHYIFKWSQNINFNWQRTINHLINGNMIQSINLFRNCSTS